MATASRKVRKLRRIKRERTLAFRLAALRESERDHARMVAVGLEKELKKHDKPSVTITKIEEPGASIADNPVKVG